MSTTERRRAYPAVIANAVLTGLVGLGLVRLLQVYAETAPTVPGRNLLLALIAVAALSVVVGATVTIRLARTLVVARKLVLVTASA